jgi:hypothetical protein
VNFDVVVLACLFPSAHAFFLFFHDVSDLLHYPLTRTRQRWNDFAYAFCVSPGVVLLTYEERVSHNEIEESRVCAQIPSGSTW